MTRRVLLARSAIAAACFAAFDDPRRHLANAAPSSKVKVEDFGDGPSAGSVTREPRPLPTGATHVGIHWRGEGHRTATAAARLYRPTGGWSAWVDLAIDDDPFGEAETFASLLDVRGAGAVQYRVAMPGDRRLERTVVTAITADEPRAMLPSVSDALAAGPSGSFTTPDNRARGVLTREDWGCDEALGVAAGGARIWPAMFVPTKKLVVHHTATANGYADGAAEVRAIYAYHAKTKAWGDIGYNALVDRFGNVYEGRRGRATTPREVIGAGVVAGHCLRHNYGTTGVAVIGDFTKRKLGATDPNDQAMLAALEDLAVWECGRARMPADGSSEFLRSDDLWHAGMPTITGHKDSESTICPGTSLMSYVAGTLRKNAATRLAKFVTANCAVTRSAPSHEVAAPASVTFAWKGSAARTEWRLEGWRRINADDIEYWTPGGWTTTEPTGWAAAAGSGQASFAGLTPGHYTCHVRGYDAAGKLSAVEANETILGR
jgi:hypothetical protein